MPEAFTISIPQGNPRFKCNSGRELTKGSGQACLSRLLSMSAASVRTSGRRDNLPVFPIEAGNRTERGLLPPPVAETGTVRLLKCFP
jgi:hypothetical protein